MTNLFYWGILCIYSISAGESTENFPRFGPSAVSVNSGPAPSHSLWRWGWTFALFILPLISRMMFSIVSFSIQGEMNLPAYLHPLAIKPHFNEKMNIWTLHFSQQCIISGSCAFYSLLLWLKQLQWQKPGSSPSVQLFHRRQNEIDVSKDRPVLFWVLLFHGIMPINKRKKLIPTFILYEHSFRNINYFFLPVSSNSHSSTFLFIYLSLLALC